ncbi:MAG: hypothetical protein PHD51_03500 [Patescibacteria group bacterium]|nr:hypothetical protein [Patescibacteria group bacterium]MDD5490958.1 hypothetical protein [Patescibacteria group bacterium]
MKILCYLAGILVWYLDWGITPNDSELKVLRTNLAKGLVVGTFTALIIPGPWGLCVGLCVVLVTVLVGFAAAFD